MSRERENTGFICEHCGKTVLPLTNGSYRNHCPFCLYSKHVDDMPGDRAGECGGLMEPIGVEYKAAKGYQIVHKCTRCGKIVKNKAAEDADQSDDLDRIIALMNRDGR